MRRIAAAVAVAGLMIVGAAGAAEAKPLRAESGPQPNADTWHTNPWDWMSTPVSTDSGGTSTDGTNWD